MEKGDDEIPEVVLGGQLRPQDLANNWKEVESSGDDSEQSTSKPFTHLDWTQRSGSNESEPVSRGEWLYGPEYFSFLKDSMFDSSDDEPII